MKRHNHPHILKSSTLYKKKKQKLHHASIKPWHTFKKKVDFCHNTLFTILHYIPNPEQMRRTCSHWNSVIELEVEQSSYSVCVCKQKKPTVAKPSTVVAVTKALTKPKPDKVIYSDVACKSIKTFGERRCWAYARYGERYGGHYEYNKNGVMIREESYLNNKLHGGQKMYTPTGKLRAKRTYKHGKREGKEIIYLTTGKKKKGGLISKCAYKHGRKEGEEIIYHGDGVTQMMRVAYKGGRKCSYQVFRWRSGLIQSISLYKNGSALYKVMFKKTFDTHTNNVDSFVMIRKNREFNVLIRIHQCKLGEVIKWNSFLERAKGEYFYETLQRQYLTGISSLIPYIK